ncbi:MAG TPA: PEP-CTERM sorting domain-containing protein [Bryobacteraceae bacterium]|nr:PEP-CTERM sorting domain-containing protein [Bryobacteraceae bacterium]
MKSIACLGILTFAAVSPLLALTGIPTPVPEPATIALVGGGLAAAILYSRKRRGQK